MQGGEEYVPHNALAKANRTVHRTVHISLSNRESQLDRLYAVPPTPRPICYCSPKLCSQLNQAKSSHTMYVFYMKVCTAGSKFFFSKINFEQDFFLSFRKKNQGTKTMFTNQSG